MLDISEFKLGLVIKDKNQPLDYYEIITNLKPYIVRIYCNITFLRYWEYSNDNIDTFKLKVYTESIQKNLMRNR